MIWFINTIFILFSSDTLHLQMVINIKFDAKRTLDGALSVDLYFIMLLSTGIERIKTKFFFTLESNFFKAIQVNAKFRDFDFYLKIDYILKYGCKLRRISNFETKFLRQFLVDVSFYLFWSNAHQVYFWAWLHIGRCHHNCSNNTLWNVIWEVWTKLQIRNRINLIC